MDRWFKQGLAQLAATNLLRDPSDEGTRRALERRWGERLLDACSNDYLGISADLVSRETLTAIAAARPGSGASRLVQGGFAEHDELEQELASWTRAERSLLCSSAFAANTGTVPALCDSQTLLVSDALNHASLVDGCRLARARVVVTPHLALDKIGQALRDRPAGSCAWVLTEALFSMDGDSPDLPALRALCDEYDAGLLVDEAHSLGVLGPGGAGLAASCRVRPDVLVGGLGKAVGSQGGFVAGSASLRTWLWNRARPVVFSTAPSPALCRLTLEQVRRTRAADQDRQRLRLLSVELRQALTERGIPIVATGDGPIVPILLGSSERALAAMTILREHGILSQAIRPPTVPPGGARLRVTIHADWPDDAVPRLVEALEVACAS
jgi:8-amino-7-oxononanoate synthase